MDNKANELDTLLSTVRTMREHREKLESALEKSRRESRALVLELIFEHGFSLHRCTVLTGHMRPTIKVWVDAEIARRADLGLRSRITD